MEIDTLQVMGDSHKLALDSTVPQSDPDGVRAQICESMAPLFEKAEKEGLWFRSPYQDLWFSPAELKAHQAKGNFCWGPVNWELRDPAERLAGLVMRANASRAEVDLFIDRMKAVRANTSDRDSADK